jgi:hypothetical protein
MVFVLELTHDLTSLLPLLIAVVFAHAVTVLLLKRSILTEKVSRRGFHLTREYEADPLEILFVRDIMAPSVVAIPASMTHHDLAAAIGGERRAQSLFPVVDASGELVGVVTRWVLEAPWLRSIPGIPPSGRLPVESSSTAGGPIRTEQQDGPL